MLGHGYQAAVAQIYMSEIDHYTICLISASAGVNLGPKLIQTLQQCYLSPKKPIFDSKFNFPIIACKCINIAAKFNKNSRIIII